MAVLLRLRNLVPLLCMPLQHARPHAALPLQRRSVHLHPLVPALPSSSGAIDADNAAAAAANRPRLLAPVRHLLSDAVHRGYAKYNSQGLARATSNPKFVAAPDAAIVLHYSSIIRSIVNYHSFVHSRSSPWKVTSIYRKSCALTLARKHSLTSAQAASSKFGPKLRISTPDSKVDAIILFLENYRKIQYSLPLPGRHFAGAFQEEEMALAAYPSTSTASAGVVRFPTAPWCAIILSHTVDAEVEPLLYAFYGGISRWHSGACFSPPLPNRR